MDYYAGFWVDCLIDESWGFGAGDWHQTNLDNLGDGSGKSNCGYLNGDGDTWLWNFIWDESPEGLRYKQYG